MASDVMAINTVRLTGPPGARRPRGSSRSIINASACACPARAAVSRHRLEALVIRIQLLSAHNDCIAAGVQSDVHDGRHDDDLLSPPILFGPELPGAADDRRSRHGLPRLNAFSFWLAPRVRAVFQLSRRLMAPAARRCCRPMRR